MVDTTQVVTFCLIHGAWHDGSCWEPLTRCLESRGHGAVTPDLPLHDPQAGYEERARPAIDALEGASEPVVVVGHSMASPYAALVAMEHPGSLLVHLCPRFGGFTLPSGAPDSFRGGFPFPESRPDGTSAWDRQTAIDAMYARLPPETARRLAEHLRPMAPPPGECPVSEHPPVPTAVLYAAEDEIFEPAWERFIAREMLGVEPIELPGGHFPMAEDPDALADVLDRLARDRAQPE